jgi:hypothetical protein
LSNALVRLRYTGTYQKTFMDHGIGQVEEGAEFDVPEDQAERFTRRADVELAGESPEPPPEGAGEDEAGTGRRKSRRDAGTAEGT